MGCKKKEYRKIYSCTNDATLKDTKLLMIQNADFEIAVIFNNDNTVTFEFIIDQVLCPQVRPRSNRGRVYDPLASYKKFIRNMITRFLEENKILSKFPMNGEYHSYIEIGVKPPKSWSYIKINQALTGQLIYESYPDLDNIEKTAWDSLSELIIADDKAITHSNSKKEYYMSDYTIVRIDIIPKNENLDKNRLSKERIQEIKEIYDNDITEDEE